MVIPGNCGNIKTQNNKYKSLISLYIILKKKNKTMYIYKNWFMVYIYIGYLYFYIHHSIKGSH